MVKLARPPRVSTFTTNVKVGDGMVNVRVVAGRRIADITATHHSFTIRATKAFDGESTPGGRAAQCMRMLINCEHVVGSNVYVSGDERAAVHLLTEYRKQLLAVASDCSHFDCILDGL